MKENTPQKKAPAARQVVADRKDYKDNSITRHGMGETHGAGVLMMTVHIGTATTRGTEYALSSTMHGAPIVESNTTGKKFVFDWQDLIRHAIEVGKIDQ